MKMTPNERRPIEFNQLCAITRLVLMATPTLDDAEWKAQVKETLLRQGWQYPAQPEVLSRAMTQVEQALQKTLGPRLLRLPQAPSSGGRRRSRPARPTAEGRTSRPAGWELVSSLMAKLSRASAPSAATPSPNAPCETWAITEAEALNEFWRAAQDGDRLALLQSFAEIALVRDPQWTPAAVRADAKPSLRRVQLARKNGCFACWAGGRPLHEHHVIQLQHGGSDTARNRVLICEACHRDIHPWLAPLPRRGGEWTSVADLVASVPQQIRKASA